MKYELTVYELGRLLKEIDNKYDMNLLVKNKLSGGFVTLTGKVAIQYTPSEQKSIKGNNIIGLTINNNESGYMDLKITGIKETNFVIDIAPTKFKEIKTSGLSLNKLKESLDECKLRIDEDLIFTIPASNKTIEGFLANSQTKTCPICGDDMSVFDLAYDQNQYGKIYFKCETCGHKMNIIN